MSERTASSGATAPAADAAVDPRFVALRRGCEHELQALAHRCEGLVFANLSRVDGRGFAHHAARADVDAARIAAITCSVLALSESFAKEALRGASGYCAIASEAGSIVIVRVPTARRAFALSVGCTSQDLIAVNLRHTLDSAATIARLLEGQA